MAKVVAYNGGTKYQYFSIKNNFANVTNTGTGGSASFQFSSYEDARKAYDDALARYMEKGTLSDSDMRELNLKD